MALAAKPVSGLQSRYSQTSGCCHKDSVHLCIQSVVQTQAGSDAMIWFCLASIFSACALLVFSTSHQRLKVEKGTDIIVLIYDFNFVTGLYFWV